MATRKRSGMTTSASVPDNGGDHSGGGGSAGGYGDDVFSTYLYEGTGADREIVNGVDLDGEGGMVWIKARSESQGHALYDTERGPEKSLSSSSNAAEGLIKGVSSFNNDGFDLGPTYNSNNQNYASWTFRKAPKFFDVVTWTGDGVKGREIPHNLGCQPGMIIVKQVSGDRDWAVNHIGIDGSTQWISLNQNIATQSRGDIFGQDLNNAGTESFKVGDSPWCNGTTSEYVAYVFAHDDSDEGMIQCGSYDGVGAASYDNEIDLGWEPQFVLVKDADSAFNWYIFDTMRGIVTDGVDPHISPNKTTAEVVTNDVLKVTPTGFAITTSGQAWNNAGDKYIYMAIRRPNKPASEFEPEELFSLTTGDGVNTPGYNHGFVTDMAWRRTPASTSQTNLSSRLNQGQELEINDTLAEKANTGAMFDYMEGWWNRSRGTTLQSWGFRRTPGFFDVVPYDSTNPGGSNPPDLVVPHNLEAVPEMMWVKRRNANEYWMVWHDVMNPGDALHLNDESPLGSESKVFVSRPTAESFTLGGSSAVNAFGDHNYIAYLFASVPGICDIGTFKSAAATIDVDCGFTNGARFVLIKCVSANGDWCYFDTLMGIADDSSPFLRLNTTDAKQPGSLIFPFSNGFKVGTGFTGGYPTGADFIYMAIA